MQPLHESAHPFRRILVAPVLGHDEIIASCGGKHSLYNAFHALFQEGDEVIVPAPFWVSYADMLTLAGAAPIIVPTEERDEFRLQPAALEAAITPRTRAVIINSPSTAVW